MILTGDLHLSDEFSNEYRWEVFSKLKQTLDTYGDKDLVILGDLAHAKDKHTSELVNRVVERLNYIASSGVTIRIIKGNHDQPLQGPPYWSFLNRIPNISFYDQPTIVGKTAYLPHSTNPIEDWSRIELSSARLIFMHQTVTGASENGRVYKAKNMPQLPEGIPIYSGDIHTQQDVGNITYVGAPHPVKFGDNYACRFIQLSFTATAIKAVSLPITNAIRKNIIEIEDVAELDRLGFKEGDQIRIRCGIAEGDLAAWPEQEAGIRAWARANGVFVASVEGLPDGSADPTAPGMETSPGDVLKQFGQHEGISAALLETGMRFVERLKK